MISQTQIRSPVIDQNYGWMVRMVPWTQIKSQVFEQNFTSFVTFVCYLFKLQWPVAYSNSSFCNIL